MAIGGALMLLSPFVHFVPDPLDWDSVIVWNPLATNLPIFRIPASLSDLIKNNLSSVDDETMLRLAEEHLVFQSEQKAWEMARRVLKPKDRNAGRIVVMPSGWCQLACNERKFGAYCGQAHTKDRLGSQHTEMILARIEEIVSTSSTNAIDLAFFGGEPLTQKNFILQTMAAADDLLQKLNRSFSREVTLSGSVISNGVLLTDGTFQELVAGGVTKFEITIDGLEEMHDVRRPFKGGEGTFRKIMANLLSISKLVNHDFKANIVIRCNVDNRNINDVFPLLSFLEESDIVPPMKFYVAPIRNWGLQRARDEFESRDAFARIELQVFNWLLRRNFKPELLPPTAERTCIAASVVPSVLAPDGHWYFCTETPISSLPTVSREAGRKWPDIKINDWVSSVERGETPCLSCCFLPVCGGACPKEWIEKGKPCPPFVENITGRISLWAIANEGALPSFNSDLSPLMTVQ